MLLVNVFRRGYDAILIGQLEKNLVYFVIFFPLVRFNSESTLKRNKKKAPMEVLKMKKALKITIIVAIAVIAVVGGVLGGVFGTISASAQKSENLTREQAQEVALGYITQELGEDKYILSDWDRDLESSIHLNESFFVYEFEYTAKGLRDDVSVHVNAKTGEASFYNVYDRD